jgi:hypothetical protein
VDLSASPQVVIATEHSLADRLLQMANSTASTRRERLNSHHRVHFSSPHPGRRTPCTAAIQQVEAHLRMPRGPEGPRPSPSRCAAVVDPGAWFLPRANQTSSARLPAAIGANTARPTAQSVARVVVDQCANAHRSPTEAHLDARANLASTPSSPSFTDWYKCGSRTRDARLIRPLLYPSELTCGGMKQSGRAVRPCATRCGAQVRQVGL